MVSDHGLGRGQTIGVDPEIVNLKTEEGLLRKQMLSRLLWLAPSNCLR